MVGITDPARELMDLCEGLVAQSSQPGAAVIATRFRVSGWSTEFYQIIFALNERFDHLRNIIADLDMDDDIRTENIGHLNAIASAFGPNGLNNQWTNSVQTALTPANIRPIKSLSPLVRAKYQLPKLTPEEVGETVEMVDELLTWLAEHQLVELDFIRQALIDGLNQFRFRLERLEWVGWGYTLAGLRDVLGAYFALESGIKDSSASPDAAAMLKKTEAMVRRVFDKVKLAKDAFEAGKFLLMVYGAAAALAHGQSEIAGLLTYSPLG